MQFVNLYESEQRFKARQLSSVINVSASHLRARVTAPPAMLGILAGLTILGPTSVSLASIFQSFGVSGSKIGQF
jgi:hypothetical protein